MSIPTDPSHMQEMPPARALLRLTTSYWVSRAIYAVAKLGIADLLRDGPQGSDVLAQATGTDARAEAGPDTRVTVLTGWRAICDLRMHGQLAAAA